MSFFFFCLLQATESLKRVLKLFFSFKRDSFQRGIHKEAMAEKQIRCI